MTGSDEKLNTIWDSLFESLFFPLLGVDASLVVMIIGEFLGW